VQATKGLATSKPYGEIAKGGTYRDPNKTVTIIMGGQAFLTLPAGPPALVLGNGLLEIFHGIGQSQGRISRLARVAKIQTEHPFPPMPVW
ncbi:MAG: hypothetical protein HUU20_29285, partial [Pirellulales bacterium]|nr:hypothetical protein [Pirellulales bacterium]